MLSVKSYEKLSRRTWVSVDLCPPSPNPSELPQHAVLDLGSPPHGQTSAQAAADLS